MLEKDKKETITSSMTFVERKEKREHEEYLRARKGFAILGIVLGFALIVGIYFLSDVSRVWHVSIIGNDYLDSDYLRELSGVKEEDYLLLVNTGTIKKNILQDSMVKSVEVTKEEGNLIAIHVEEYKLIGYTLMDGATCYVKEDGSLVEMSKENANLITRMPLIEGFDSDDLVSIAKGFSSVDKEIIEEISEIHQYSFSYDENMMELIMKDGNYCFVSSFGLKLLDEYHSVVSELGMNNENVCLYIDEVTNTYQYRKCPWEFSNTESNTEE